MSRTLTIGLLATPLLFAALPLISVFVFDTHGAPATEVVAIRQEAPAIDRDPVLTSVEPGTPGDSPMYGMADSFDDCHGASHSAIEG
jgi:hypothetical protein